MKFSIPFFSIDPIMSVRYYATTARLLILGLTTALLPLTVFAASNPDIYPPPPPPGCPENGPATSTASFNARFYVGEGHYKKPDLLQVARAAVGEGQKLGAMPRTLDQLFQASYNSNVISGLDSLDLTVETIDLEASILTPATLKMVRSTNAEVIEINGAIRQVFASNTLADVVPLAVGYHIKVYDRSAAGNKDANGLYTILANNTPLNESIVRTPGGAPFTNQIELVLIDRKNPSPRTVVERFILNQALDKLTKETYAATLDGSGAAVMGSLQETDAITYSNRGTRRYDYTLTREISRASTALDGSQGPLTLVARRQEVYQDFSPSSGLGGDSTFKRLLSTTEGLGTDKARTTNYTWYSSTNLQIHGRLKSMVTPDGKWEYYEYTDSVGAAAVEIKKYSSWQDVAITNFTQARLEKTSVNSTTGYTKVISINGVTLNIEDFTTIPQSGGELLNTQTLKDSANTVLSKRVWQLNSELTSPEKAGRIAWMENIDGTAETYAYGAGASPSDGSFTLIHRKGAGSRNGITLGTQTDTTYNKFIQASSEIKKDIVSDRVIGYWIAPSVDITGRPTRIEYNGNAADYETFQYACCGLERTRSRDGSVITYARDAKKRVYRVESYRFETDPAPIAITSAFSGLTTTTLRGGILQSEVTIDLNGETVSIKSPDQNGDGIAEVTSVVTEVSTTTGKTVTTTFPDNGTEIQKTYLDGRMKSTEGTAVPDAFYTYALISLSSDPLNGNGLCTQTFYSAINSSEWQKSTTDALSRIAKVEFPAAAPATVNPTINYVYNAGNAIAGSATQLQSITDADGKLTTYLYNSKGERTTTTEPVPGGQSRITEVLTSVVNVPSRGDFLQTQTKLNGTSVNTIQRSVDEYTTIGTTPVGTTITVQTVATINGDATVTTIKPDNTQEVRTITGNLVKKVANLSTTGVQITATTYDYDSLRRMQTSTDARVGTTILSNYTDAGHARTTTLPGSRVTSVTFDNMGRQLKLDAPDSAITSSSTPCSNLTFTSYYQNGRIKAQWGAQTNAALYFYDEQNRMTGLRTYRSLALGTEPVSTVTGFDSTSWIYDLARGWLIGKRDATNLGVNYTYTPAGRLLTRQWARGAWTRYDYHAASGIQTATRYFTAATTASNVLSAVTGNDPATPDADYTFYSSGMLDTATTFSGTGPSRVEYTRNKLTYTNNFTIDKEDITVDPDGSGPIPGLTRTLDRKEDTLLRSTGWELLDGATTEHANSYTYHPTDGRLNTVTGSASTFTYGYTSNSYGLIDTVTGPAHTVTNYWLPDRDSLDFKENKVGINLVSKYDYDVNAISQRQGVITSGSAFGTAVDTTVWGYDALGQVVRADQPTASKDFGYVYDQMGNRQRSSRNDTNPATATGTNLGIYRSTVTVGSAEGGNSLNQYGQLELYGAISTASYDQDGNLNTNRYWDGENQLIRSKVGGPPIVITDYIYDAFHRRVAKRNTTGEVTLTLYDGWNLISEYQTTSTASPTLLASYTWGKDLSGTFQGAGGVGGLLVVKQYPTGVSYYPTYDGNGNISEYLNNTGTTAAHYEYGPFGEQSYITPGSLPASFRHRFSTKPIDIETGYYYYGYRSFDPLSGRWLNRDPIGERGGIAMYGFTQNNPVNFYDLLGNKKRNCSQKLSQTLGYRLGVDRIGAIPMGWLSFSGSQTVEGKVAGVECEECCSDGQWKKVITIDASLSLKGSISLTGGPQINISIPNVGGVSGYIGIKGTLEGSASVSGSGDVGGCKDKPGFKVKGGGSVTGSLTGGAQLQLRLGNWNWNAAEGTVTGSLSKGITIEGYCDGGGCSFGDFKFDNEWKGKVVGKACAAGFCAESTLWEG